MTGNDDRSGRRKLIGPISKSRAYYALCCGLVLFISAALDDLKAIVGQRSLQRLCFIPWRPHPYIELLSRSEDHRHCFRMNRLDYGVGFRGEKAIDQMWPWNWLRLSAALAPIGRPEASKSEQGPLIAQGKPDYVLFLVAGLGSGAYSEKLEAGTRQRCSGLSQPRQCGDDVLRILVIGYSPNLGGGGPAHFDQLALSFLGAYNGGLIIWEHTRHAGEIASAVQIHIEKTANGVLILGDAIKIAHKLL